MSHYERLARRATGVAYILGPLLLTAAAAVYVLGIERSPDGTSSWVEGVLMAFAWPLFVPVYLDLARRLGERAPRFAIFCAATGLYVVLALQPAFARLFQVDIIMAGLDESIWRVGVQHAGWAPLIIGMALGLLTATFLGIGLLWKGGIPRWSAALLAAAPVLLLIGQGGDDTIAWWQVNIVYPLACLSWLAALAPSGWRMLKADTAQGRTEISSLPAD
jgi:hypothetical protein